MPAAPATANEHREQSLRLLAEAREEFAQGDLAQASKKGWRAVARITMAVGAHRGWEHDSHELLYDAVERIAEETEDTDGLHLFIQASALHTNFYEGWMPRRAVESGLDAVARYVALMERVLDASK